MTKYHKSRNDYPDANQGDIVEALRKAGAHVQTGHDDLLVAWCGKMFQIELKSECIYTKTGDIKAGILRPNQIELLNSHIVNYAVCRTFDQVWQFINGQSGDYLTPEDYKQKIHMRRWKKR